jgi:Uma2 family endonuclease
MTTRTLMMAAEFWQSGPDTDGYELVRGELVPLPPPGDRHGVSCANVAFLLKTYTRQVGRGVVMSNDAGILTARSPDSVREVDVALYLDPRWQGKAAPEGYSDQPPDVVAEVRSPSQPWGDLVVKAGEYLTMGCGSCEFSTPGRSG